MHGDGGSRRGVLAVWLQCLTVGVGYAAGARGGGTRR